MFSRHRNLVFLSESADADDEVEPLQPLRSAPPGNKCGFADFNQKMILFMRLRQAASMFAQAAEC
jgi:hypothetical protein